MSLRLKDHVALITGASRGIGRASAIALAAEGAKIVGVARTKAELDALVAQITSSGGAAIAVVADVTKSADVARSVQEAVAAFGRVDILVNDVGMGGYRPFLEWSEEDYDRIMATNAKSSWLYAREVILRHAQERRLWRTNHQRVVRGRSAGVSQRDHLLHEQGCATGPHPGPRSRILS